MSDKRTKILLIEDNPGDARLIQEMLAEVESGRFEMEWADRLSTGLDYLVKGEIDVVLLDLGLPDNQGLDILHKVRAQAPPVPIVVVTGLDDETLAVQAMRQGAQDYLIKGDVDSKTLWRVMRYAIERRQVEEALRESEEKWRTLTENSPDTIMVIDEGGKIEYINRIISGLTKEQVVGTSVFDHLSEESIDIQKKAIDHVIQTGESMQYQLNYMTPEDHTVVYESNIGPVVQDGKVTAIVISSRDISEHIKLEEERQKAAKLESVGTLAGGIAHDFNNLLTGIMGNISLAKRYIEPKSKAEDRLLEAEKASLRAKDLTQQLLTFSKGGVPIKKTVSIAGLLKESAGFSLSGSSIRCDFDLPDDLWSVLIDEGQINQVFSNIIINAVQAMPNGGIINIMARNLAIDKEITLPLSKGNYVEIAIEDHGTGIPKDHLDRIFEPYFTTKQKGSGLGLATAYSIIKNHDGHITVESAISVGTTIHIYLPAAKKRVLNKEEEGTQPALLGEGRVLVMDDEETIRELLYTELTEVGYDVEPTHDGVEAIEQYRGAKEAGQPFDAVILDLTVPGGMGGKETIKKLLEIDPDVKAIVSSGYATDSTMSDYKKYGFSAVVTKPYSVGQLEKTLQGLLKKK
ncbi:response regulator [Chloroflexota bacterium]